MTDAVPGSSTPPATDAHDSGVFPEGFVFENADDTGHSGYNGPASQYYTSDLDSAAPQCLLPPPPSQATHVNPLFRENVQRHLSENGVVQWVNPDQFWQEIEAPVADEPNSRSPFLGSVVPILRGPDGQDYVLVPAEEVFPVDQWSRQELEEFSSLSRFGTKILNGLILIPANSLGAYTNEFAKGLGVEEWVQDDLIHSKNESDFVRKVRNKLGTNTHGDIKDHHLAGRVRAGLRRLGIRPQATLATDAVTTKPITDAELRLMYRQTLGQNTASEKPGTTILKRAITRHPFYSSKNPLGFLINGGMQHLALGRLKVEDRLFNPLYDRVVNPVAAWDAKRRQGIDLPDIESRGTSIDHRANGLFSDADYTSNEGSMLRGRFNWPKAAESGAFLVVELAQLYIIFDEVDGDYNWDNSLLLAEKSMQVMVKTGFLIERSAGLLTPAYSSWVGGLLERQKQNRNLAAHWQDDVVSKTPRQSARVNAALEQHRKAVSQLHSDRQVPQPGEPDARIAELGRTETEMSKLVDEGIIDDDVVKTNRGHGVGDGLVSKDIAVLEKLSYEQVRWRTQLRLAALLLADLASVVRLAFDIRSIAKGEKVNWPMIIESTTNIIETSLFAARTKIGLQISADIVKTTGNYALAISELHNPTFPIGASGWMAWLVRFQQVAGVGAALASLGLAAYQYHVACESEDEQIIWAAKVGFCSTVFSVLGQLLCLTGALAWPGMLLIATGQLIWVYWLYLTSPLIKDYTDQCILGVVQTTGLATLINDVHDNHDKARDPNLDTPEQLYEVATRIDLDRHDDAYLKKMHDRPSYLVLLDYVALMKEWQNNRDYNGTRTFKKKFLAKMERFVQKWADTVSGRAASFLVSLLARKIYTRENYAVGRSVILDRYLEDREGRFIAKLLELPPQVRRKHLLEFYQIPLKYKPQIQDAILEIPTEHFQPPPEPVEITPDLIAKAQQEWSNYEEAVAQQSQLDESLDVVPG